jgi:hypothetical protein
VTGPTSTPRGERAGKPGARWETELVWGGEQIVDDDAEPRANRAARRAAKRLRGRVGAQQAREGAWVPLSRPNSPQRTRIRQEAQNGAQSLESEPSTQRSPE